MPEGGVQLLAHRGVHQYLENTIESMKKAFAFGADIIEIDIHPTSDGKFAVFHDWTIDCRTEGKGVTREHSLSYLQSLDIGYGYTHDQGKTYPFRGLGVSAMSSLTEVLNTFPTQRILINIKSNSESEAKLIDHFLRKRAEQDRKRLMFYGGEKPTKNC